MRILVRAVPTFAITYIGAHVATLALVDHGPAAAAIVAVVVVVLAMSSWLVTDQPAHN